MKHIIYLLVFLAVITTQSACSNNDPGLLAGTWQTDNPTNPITIQFRSGEVEAIGVIKKVSYKADGNSIIVFYKDSVMKGSSSRYQLVDSNTVNNGMGTMHRIK